MRVGIDVGGTNTDAVLMDDRRVIADVKTPTTADVTGGIVTALQALVSRSDVGISELQAVMIGTTHFTNAVVEAKRLMPTACIRLGLPATKALPPMVDWPSRLKQALGDHSYLCHGGHEFDGREISALRPDELQRVANEVGANGIRSVAISSVFSPVNAEFEQQAAEIIRQEIPSVAISLSHEIGRIGLLERENATIMNACLRGLATHIVAAFNEGLAALGVTAPIYLSQNDGTLMSVGYAEQYPVATFASGPTNSMRGAAFLSGLQDAVVVDIGGTTSDVGMLQNGFPRESATATQVGGVRTNFRMPDVYSFGLGGGSLVREDDQVSIGPDSVGYELTQRALVFGGSDLTTTDIAVAAGLADIGDSSRVAHLDRDLVERAQSYIENQIVDSVDRMKTSSGDVPVVVVGGASVLVGETLAGASEVIKPEYFAVANAIGAAIAQIGGEVDRIFSLSTLSRHEALDRAKQEAVEKAVAAGAQRETVNIVDVEEIPLTYLPSNATRIHIKVVGELELGRENIAAHR